MENWVPIEEFPHYEVSDRGRVRNTRTHKVLALFRKRDRLYAFLVVRQNGTSARSVDRLVALAFVGCPIYPSRVQYSPEHIDGDTLNNDATNLCWVHKNYDNRRGGWY
jgi:hypothetical protein